MNDFYSQEELAEAWGCDSRYIGKLKKEGLLSGIKIGRHNVFFAEDIQKFWDTYRDFDLSSVQKMTLAKQIKSAAGTAQK